MIKNLLSNNNSHSLKNNSNKFKGFKSENQQKSQNSDLVDDFKTMQNNIYHWLQNYNQPPAWIPLAEQFDLSKAKCKNNNSKMLLRKQVKDWYEKEIYSKRKILPNDAKCPNITKLSKKVNWHAVNYELIFLEVESIKEKISNWSQNYKKPPAWIKVAKEFDLSIEKTSSPLVRKQVKDWYQKEIYSNPKFDENPIIDKSNQLKFNNRNKNYKRTTKYRKRVRFTFMNLDQEKKKILNFVENQIEPLSWVHIANHFYYYQKYTNGARQPLQKWYQDDLYPKLLAKITETSNNQRTVLDINTSKINLKTLLIECFQSSKTNVKETLSIVDNIQHYKYYMNFFDIFIPKLLSCCLLPNNALNYLEPYHQVYDLTSFKEYLRNTPGLYCEMILWAIDNPFPFPSAAICNQHHAMPKFLYNQKNEYGFSKQEIEKPYNLVYLGWLIHYLLHLIRLIEYNQPQDYSALGVTISLIKRQGKNKNLVHYYKKWDYIASQMQVLNHCLNNDLNINSSRRNLSSGLIKLLTINTDWRSCQGFINKDGRVVEFSFSHLAQNPKMCSLDNLANLLIENDLKRSVVTGLPKQISGDRRKIIDYIRHYLATIIRTKKIVSIYGFYIINAEPLVPRWPELMPYSSYVSEKVAPTNIYKARFIVKSKNILIPDIVGLPGDFRTIQDLVNLCAKKQYEYLNLPLSKKSYYRLTDYFKYRIEMSYKQGEQHSFHINWQLTLLPII